MFNGNIVTAEVSLNQRSLLIWAFIVIIVVLVYLGSFSFINNLGIVEMIEEYPEVLITVLGMTPDRFTDVNRYHGGLVMLYVLLLASIYAMMLAGGMVTRDVDLCTVEFLYTRPVSRSVIFLSKALAFLITMTLFWIVIYLASTAMGIFWVAPGQFDISAQFTAHLMGYLACLAAGGTVLALAPFFNRSQTTTSLAIGLGFAFFLLNSLAAIYEQLYFLKYLSIHYYADMGGAAVNDPFELGMIVLPAVFVVGVATGSLLIRWKNFMV